MITCMGLVVGSVTTPDAQDVLNQCARFLKKYKHLLSVPKLQFIIDGVPYCTVIDTHQEKKEVLFLCELYNGRTMIGTSERH